MCESAYSRKANFSAAVSCRLSGLANLKALQRRLAGFFKHCTISGSSAMGGDRALLGGLDSPVSYTASVSSGERGVRGAKKCPTSTAASSQFAFSLPSWPLWELMGRGGARTRRKDIRAIGAQSCVTTVLERLYVMDR